MRYNDNNNNILNFLLVFDAKSFIAPCSVAYFNNYFVSVVAFLIYNVHQRWSWGHKVRGQGQRYKKNPRPRRAFPRTDTLEAKDRNARGQGQGPRTRRKCSPKKKGLQKKFLGNLQFIGVPRIFDWGRPKPQTTWNDVVNIFPNRKFLWDKDIVGWEIWNRCLLARNQDVAKGS